VKRAVDDPIKARGARELAFGRMVPMSAAQARTWHEGILQKHMCTYESIEGQQRQFMQEKWIC
jgi:hypothetical protein